MSTHQRTSRKTKFHPFCVYRYLDKDTYVYLKLDTVTIRLFRETGCRG